MSNAYRATQLAIEVGRRASESFPDTVTFSRPTSAKDSSGGTTYTNANTSPANVPCRYRPSSGDEVELAGKTISGNAYTIIVPAYFSSALVDVDSKSKAVVAARSGGEVSRTFNIVSIGRVEGICIHLLATIEE